MTFAKWTLYDAGIRNQIIARWPGRIAPSSVTDAMVQYCDLVPTWIDAAGGTPGTELDGRSCLNVPLGKQASAREVVFGVHATAGIRNGQS